MTTGAVLYASTNSVSIPEVEFLSLLQEVDQVFINIIVGFVSIPEVEFLSLLHGEGFYYADIGKERFNSRSGIPQLAPRSYVEARPGEPFSFNSRSGIPQLAPIRRKQLQTKSANCVSIPEVEFLSLLRSFDLPEVRRGISVSIPEVEFLSLLPIVKGTT